MLKLLKKNPLSKAKKAKSLLRNVASELDSKYTKTKIFSKRHNLLLLVNPWHITHLHEFKEESLILGLNKPLSEGSFIQLRLVHKDQLAGYLVCIVKSYIKAEDDDYYLVTCTPDFDVSSPLEDSVSEIMYHKLYHMLSIYKDIDPSKSDS
jgi:hypothetical protein